MAFAIPNIREAAGGPSLPMQGPRDSQGGDQRTEAERVTTAHLHQSRPILGLDELVTTPLTLGQSVDPTLAKSYQDRLKTAESDIRIFIDRDATERHEALNRFRDMARNIESTAEADHDAGRIPEGGYLAIMERLNTMFRRVPADA